MWPQELIKNKKQRVCFVSDESALLERSWLYFYLNPNKPSHTVNTVTQESSAGSQDAHSPFLFFLFFFFSPKEGKLWSQAISESFPPRGRWELHSWNRTSQFCMITFSGRAAAGREHCAAVLRLVGVVIMCLCAASGMIWWRTLWVTVQEVRNSCPPPLALCLLQSNSWSLSCSAAQVPLHTNSLWTSAHTHYFYYYFFHWGICFPGTMHSNQHHCRCAAGSQVAKSQLLSSSQMVN